MELYGYDSVEDLLNGTRQEAVYCGITANQCIDEGDHESAKELRAEAEELKVYCSELEAIIEEGGQDVGT